MFNGIFTVVSILTCVFFGAFFFLNDFDVLRIGFKIKALGVVGILTQLEPRLSGHVVLFHDDFGDSFFDAAQGTRAFDTVRALGD